MDKKAMILHNESTAYKKIRSAYKKYGLPKAMRLCSEFMGLEFKAAYNEVRKICADIWEEQNDQT